MDCFVALLLAMTIVIASDSEAIQFSDNEILKCCVALPHRSDMAIA
jgi:hypothetical protein